MIDKSPKPIYEYKGVNYNGEYVAHYEGYITSYYNHGKERMRKPGKGKKGYLQLTLSKDGKQTGTSIHRLVATYFCENDDPANKTSVDHIDGDKENNCASNLEWVTPHENLLRARKLGLKRMIVTEELCHEICDMIWNKNMSDTEISKKLGISVSNIYSISSGKTHRYISEKYSNGNWSPNSDRLSEEHIHQICDMIWIKGLTDTEIGKELGVSNKKVYEISSGGTHRHISDKYSNGNWSPNSNRLSEELIHQICDMIWNKNMTDTEISREMGIHVATIYNISSGKNHRHISDKYANGNWSPNSNINKLTEEKIHEICKLRWIKHYSRKEIVNKTGINKFTIRHIIYGRSNKDISLPYIKKAYNDLSAITKRFMRTMYRELEGGDRDKIKETQRVFPEIDGQVIKYAICTISDELNKEKLNMKSP